MTDLTARLDAIKGATVTYAPQPYHKLNRQQLLTLCIALEDQRDRALDLARKQQAAIEAVTKLADGWHSRGEHDMKFSKTIPDEDIALAILADGAQKVENARMIREALEAKP